MGVHDAVQDGLASQTSVGGFHHLFDFGFSRDFLDVLLFQDFIDFFLPISKVFERAAFCEFDDEETIFCFDRSLGGFADLQGIDYLFVFLGQCTGTNERQESAVASGAGFIGEALCQVGKVCSAGNQVAE